MNYLCIDIGNTRIKYLVYENDRPVDYSTSDNWDQTMIEKLASRYQIKHISICSVRQSVPCPTIVWPKGTSVILLDHHTNIPIKNSYQTPETLGKDRLAAVIGAHYLYPDEHLIVIDLGTCITYDFIDKEGEYHGGNIAPGALMRLKAMNHYTKNLPLVTMEYHEDLLGKNTEMALQNGVVRGTIYEIESFIKGITEKYGHLKTIFTGGDAKYFASYINNEIFAHQNLVLRGLKKIIQHNEH